MSDEFSYFSDQYAQALQAFTTIQNQASTLMLMGNNEDLRKFLEQFIAMAVQTKAAAEDKGEANFAEWFGELVTKAETLLQAVPHR
ncbi:MAG: hypothetical protein JOZ54_19450 [Acidobacteria bacterium]|nr:hypothetical protein [Acidobacteriota bacterium]